MISNIFPTGYFGAELAEVTDGDTVAVFGCGPVRQFAITGAFIMGAGIVFAVDREEPRLEMARAQGARTVNFEEEDPVEAIYNLTGGIGVDRIIEAVGVDAVHAHSGPVAEQGEQMAQQFDAESRRSRRRRTPRANRRSRCSRR